MKSHGNEVTDFYDKKNSKVDSNHTCLAVISLDFALKKDDSYYLEVFLKECKYIEKKVIRNMKDNLSDFSYFDEPDEDQIKATRSVCFENVFFRSLMKSNKIVFYLIRTL